MIKLAFFALWEVGLKEQAKDVFLRFLRIQHPSERSLAARQSFRPVDGGRYGEITGHWDIQDSISLL